ncbi:hypothetical protein CFE70_003269 [Pyrenophora teres f. teres 0-1]|uniref:Uncharacterized protein n=1 Tax=Pyrenophora teres f. teres (strain 0-1) TaxID=861557 RepID=E3RKA6_PYRTT|nr:hypothetical protein PTT_08654 [Pyrenophora teres f. teres 0-1]KAE8853433.1 hypothetical protein HRS9122_00425 [Pyrenophora teres f. teres]KAE8873091.1 hypothetical protein PTNB73_02242 [Pyrenophora teres f. teres]
MRFSSIVAALSLAVIAQCYAISEATTADKHSCVTGEQILATHYGLEYLSKQYDIPFPEEFPNLDEIRDKAPNECVVESVSHAAADAMVRISKEHDFESKYAELVGRSPARLFRRSRSCPEIRDETPKMTESTWSCRSAPNFSRCKSCTGLTTLGFFASMGVCFAKKLEETVPCCVLAATIYVGTYSHICLYK